MAQKLEETYIANTVVTTVGTGLPLLVIHGGPGLDHTYLLPWLLPLASSRRLVFYDQLACGRDRTPIEQVSVRALVHQLVELLRKLDNQPVGVFAHSWGAYLLYESLHSNSNLCLRETVFCSPVGLTRDRFDASGDRLIARIPQDALASVESLEEKNDHIGVMRTLLPYYIADSAVVPAVNFGFYDPAVYSRVLESLDNYDCRGIARRIPQSALFIYGDKDIEIPEATEEINSDATLALINGAGHFAFAEQPTSFLNVLNKFFKEQ